VGRGEVYTGLWWGNMRERDHLKGPGVDGRVKLRMGSAGMGWVQN